MKIQAVLFDMDGLMLDTERLTISAWDWAGEQLGFGPLGYLVFKTLGMNRQGSEEVFRQEFGGRLTGDQLSAFTSQYFHEYFAKQGVPVKDGLFPLLAYLKEKGYRRCVVTSTSEKTARAELEQAGILPWFDGMVCGNMVTHGKPAPDIYLLAAERMGLEPAHCLALEDSPNGIRSAFAAGVNPVVIPDLVEPDEEILGKAVARLQSLAEVPALLEKLEK